MSGAALRYHADEWAHDLGQWWTPLAVLAREADTVSDAWLEVLGVHEFFDQHLLGQVGVLTPWICLAASAVSASSARQAAQSARLGQAPDEVAYDLARAIVAFELAVSLEQLRLSNVIVGAGITSSANLIDTGLGALSRSGHALRVTGATDPVGLVSGWLALSGHPVPSATTGCPGGPAELTPATTPGDVVARIAKDATLRWPDSGPLVWGTAHLVERLAGSGALDDLALPAKPDDPPAEACANVLLVSGQGVLGLFEARRQRSLLDVPIGIAVPDLARLAFIRPGPDFLGSIADSLTAARRVGLSPRRGEVMSWSLQLPSGHHPLAERAVSGRSAGLGAYVAFRSLDSPGTFAFRDVAFTGQVMPDGSVGKVHDARDKIEAAARHQIRLVMHPAGQAWRDPTIAVRLEAVHRAEDALIAAAWQLRHLRSYLEAACHLVTPEPWLQAWLSREGQRSVEIPMLDVMCRQISSDDDSGAGWAADSTAHVPPPGLPVPGLSGDGLPAAVPLGGPIAGPKIPSCAAHLLAVKYPACSFAVGAEPGAGSTVAAKRMVAEAARRALDTLRALTPADQPPAFTLPLYTPLWEQPASWDDLVRCGVEALPDLTEPSLDVAAALACALRGDTVRSWRPLVVADGTDRIRRGGGNSEQAREREFVALIAGSGSQGHPVWRPRLVAQIVLCGRSGSPSHQVAAEALLRLRPGSAALMHIDPLGDREIDRFIAGFSAETQLLNGWNRDLAANPLLLTLSVIAGHPGRGEFGVTDLFDRGLNMLLGERRAQRSFLAEIAFRAATSKGEPAGDFSLSEIAAVADQADVARALANEDLERALAIALDRDERHAFQSAEQETYLLTASRRGWRFFHDRAFAFLVADRIAGRVGEGEEDDDALFGPLREHLGDPLWSDVIEATGRLLELRGSATRSSAAAPDPVPAP